METRVAVMSIIVENPQAVEKLNALEPVIYCIAEAELDEMMQKGILSEEFFYERHMFGYGRKIPVYYYSEEEPPKMVGGNYDNNYWHYDENGNPVIWEKG